MRNTKINSRVRFKKVKIDFFGHPVSMTIFDYDEAKKRGLDGLSGGVADALDIISKSLDYYQNWEPYQTEITKEILKNGNNIFIDIGSHLGYYSLLASVYNNNVISIEKNTNFIKLFKKTISDNKIQNIDIWEKFVDNTFSLKPFVNIDSHIKLLKCSIEGFEIEVIDSILERLKQKTIENLILEISPTVRDNYPEYIMKLKELGYFVYDLGLCSQRKLDNSTTLKSLKMINIENVEDMRKYVNNLPDKLKPKQSNFLFSTINYVK